ncbi:bifunctional metallophosphatase/5'-nucleotidase [Kurthia senegalensis]|uniref:bifunctional metallophosphatase/5'-nucleotidase n=1 Tax=Kurthia senegalensis TaxID=1033740 RepID=UPI000288F2C6|nr:metallophosphoesterase [Kurthia senegalensis]
MEKIHIYHTNDVHSHLDSWPRTRAFLQRQRQYHEVHGETCFIFDLGDFIDRSNVFTEATLGKSSIPLLNDATYDAVTLGNNEGITLSKGALEHLYDEAHFDVIVSNLKEADGTQPKWVQNEKVYTSSTGKKIGIVAATAPFADFYNNLGWQIQNPFQTLADSVERLKGKVDAIVCLSHLGLQSDEQLAEMMPELTLIIGAHTHHVLERGKQVQHVLLTGGGKYGTYIGHSVITFGEERTTQTELIETATLPAERGEHREVEAQQRYGEQLLDVEVFRTTKYYNKEWYHYSKLSDFFAEALLDFSQADCAFFNAGIFLTPMKKGSITANDVHKMLPHPINACVLYLNQSQLKSLILYIEEKEELSRYELKGLGFRGKVIGKMLLYGFEEREDEIYVNNRRLEEGETIAVATLDSFTFGWIFPELKDLPKKYLLPQFLRDILTIYGHRYFE